jgi:hypothetical protein
MAKLTTVDGIEITFNPRSLWMVIDHDAVTHALVTTVYGIKKAPVLIKEEPAAFLNRVKISDNFAVLTRADNSPIWINAPAVSSVYAPQPKLYVPEVKSVIEIGSMSVGIVETTEEAIAALNARGGDL